MRLPVVTTERHMLERGGCEATVKFVEKQLCEFRGPVR
jgi:competence protein ComGC